MDLGSSEKPNSYLFARIEAAMCFYTNGNPHSSPGTDETSHLELDSHANMPVVGCESLVIDDLGVNVDVCPFSPDYPSMQVKLVDAVVQYECPFTGKVFMLLICNAVHVPAMSNNLIPPFFREAGITVNDVPKIQKDPTVRDHALIFPETNFIIPLKLWGIFSYLPTFKPIVEDFEACEDLYTLTPMQFNPHSTSYAQNEAIMVDWEGNMIEQRHRNPILLEEVTETLAMALALQIGAAEAAAIDGMISEPADSGDDELDQHKVPREADEVTGGLLGMSPLLSDDNLHAHLATQGQLGRDQIAIGATTVSRQQYFLDDDHQLDVSEEREFALESTEGCDQLFQDSLQGEVYLDAYMVSAAHKRPKIDMDAEHSTKIWRIDLQTAQRTLEMMSQQRKNTPLETLTHNYSTNDCMLRYKRIDEHFFMDTFFATKDAKKGGKSSRGHTCCQLFATDKGFIYLVPMMFKSEVLQAVKQFAKEIGAPEAIVAVFEWEQASCCCRMVVTRVIANVVCVSPGISHMPGHPGQNPDIHPGYDRTTIRVHSQKIQPAKTIVMTVWLGCPFRYDANTLGFHQ
jgi:hypothetical protein